MLVINAAHVNKNYSGVGVYFFSLASRLTKKFESGIIYSGFDFRSGNFSETAKNWRVKIIKFAGRDLFRWLWVQLILPFKLLNTKNILYSPFSESPVFCRCKTVMVVHDLIPIKFENEHSWKLRFYYRHILPMSLKRAGRIITISNAVKSDILKFFPKIGADKINVIYNGYEKTFFNNVKPETSGKFENKYGIENYILYVGRISEVKNTMSLVQAFAPLANKTDVILLIIGRDESGITEKAMKFARENNFESRIKFIDYLPEEDLAKAYKSARLFVFPSFAEGFGLPLVEAMASGVPAVISDIPSLSEIAGDAAVKFNPQNYMELSEKILLMLNDKNLSETCITKGIERAKLFDWDKTAEQTAKIISELVLEDLKN